MAADDAGSRVQREQDFHDKRFAEDDGDRPASRFYRVATGINDYFQNRVARIKPGQKVLELGCGLEVAAWELAERGVEVTGIDISAVAIELVNRVAEERGLADHATFLQMDAESLTFPDESFDVVIGNGILHHLDLDTALAEFDRVLRPGGWAMFREPMGHNPFINGYRKLTPNQRTDDEHPLLDTDLRTIERSFPDSEFEYFNMIDLLALGALKWKYFESIRSFLAKIDTWLFAKLPSLRRFGWMVGIEVHKHERR